uniref:Sphingomyelin phosphodiesterase n=1 Tax=Tetraselmis sp. GSL018 TaxID=582737 RepID=A0A061RB85_9CHLO
MVEIIFMNVIKHTSKYVFAVYCFYILLCGLPSEARDDGRISVLHLTDLHIDLSYAAGSESLCLKPPCCRIASDPSLPIRSPAGFVGEYNCGTRLEVLQSALEAVHARPDVVVWTGDNAPHHEGTTREDVLATFKAVTRELQQRLPGVAVVPSLGNYDFVPVHSDPGPPLNSWLLGPLAELFSDWIGDEGLSTFRFAGYYDVKLAANLRAVALNTQMCHVKNLFQFVDNTLGQEQLAWLEGVLTRSKQNGERVLITGHIPPGMFGGCWGKASHEYEMLIGRFQETVVGQLFGHQHSGSFRLLREDGKYLGKPVSVAHVTPGFSTFKGGNPAFRLYELREAPTWRLAGFKQFFLQLSDYNYEARGMEPTGSLNWVLGYTAPSDLNMTDMSPTAWQQLRDRFDVDEKYKSMFHDLEGSGRPWQGPGPLSDFLCGTSQVSDGNLQECLGTNEEILVRRYTDSKHTYVITSMFPFDSVLDYFCPILQGLHPSDCPPQLYDRSHI